MTAACVTARLGRQVERLSLLAPAGWGGDRMSGDLKSLKGAMSADERRAVHRHNLGVALLANPANVTNESVTLQTYNIESASFDSASTSGHVRLFPALAQYDGPLQLIIGTGDIVQVPSVEGRIAKMQEAFPRIRVDRLEGAAHWAQYDQAEGYNKALIAFMRDDAA
jgi:pimeloyl-ACP methyl ester carboxylesterase